MFCFEFLKSCKDNKLFSKTDTFSIVASNSSGTGPLLITHSLTQVYIIIKLLNVSRFVTRVFKYKKIYYLCG